MQRILVSLLVILICGVLGFCVWRATADQPQIQRSDSTEMLEVFDTMKNLEGYDNLAEWTKAHTKNIKAYEGHTTSIKNELDEFMTQEQEDEMLALEEIIKHAQTIAEQKEAIEKFDSILEDINTYRSQIEAELLAKEKQVQEPDYYDGSITSFKTQGVIYWGGMRYTWYSQNVLPGGGLNIPGRHVGEDDLIYDSDQYIVVASSDYGYGTVVDTPFGTGKVYDSGCASGTIDIYTNF